MEQYRARTDEALNAVILAAADDNPVDMVRTAGEYLAAVDAAARDLTEDAQEQVCWEAIRDVYGALAPEPIPIAQDYFDEEEMTKFTCCICGCDFYDWTGNNPDPVVESDTEVCCHSCNHRFVIPARTQ